MDDIFLNTIGGILGYLVYALMQRKRDRGCRCQKAERKIINFFRLSVPVKYVGEVTQIYFAAHVNK